MNWKFWAPRGVAPKPKPEIKPVTERELAARFAAAPDNPLFEAVLTVLTERINAKATDAANEQLTDRAIVWRVAGTDALMEFYEELREREQQARRAKAETTTT